MIKSLLIIVTLMIFYDLSIHFVYLLGFEKKIIEKKINWWPNWDRWGKVERKQYQIFWNSFWGTALVLMIIALLN